MMRNWKTTAVGLLGAMYEVAQPIIATGDFNLKRDYPHLVYACVYAAFGFFAKDFNVTGNPAKTIGEDAPATTSPNEKIPA